TAPAARPGPAASLLAVPPSEMRSGLRTAYRLRPDARCLGAFSQVYAWLTGTGVLPVAATFVDGQWRLALGGTQIAALPELPDFDVRRETALLAYLLDYSEAAGRRAAQLPDADPVRLFIAHDDARLGTVAASDPGRLLMLVRLGENRDFPGWLAWVRQRYGAAPYSLPILRSALDLHA